MCTFLGIILSISSKKNSAMTFVTVFFIIWVGSFLISLNTQLIGGKMYKNIKILITLIRSVMQCICLLGYCIFPINICALLNLLILNYFPFIFKFSLVCVSFIWSTKGKK
jgi:hypothetical protein